MRTITNGQARRIAAEWQAPHNSCSLLQHKGVIDDGLIAELEQNMRHTDRAGRAELFGLIEWATTHGLGRVDNWGDWDDTPAR